jgi:hypothetical protein
MRFLPKAVPEVLLAAALILGSACSDHRPTEPPDRQGPGPALADISTLAAPGNDDFDNSTVITTLPFSETLSIAEATVAPDDELQEENCSAIGGNTIWYQFTPTRDLRLNASTVGSRPEVLVYAYTGTRGNLTLVDCSQGLPFPVVFDAVGGTTYHFMIGTDASEFRPPGTLTFTLQTSLEVSVTIDPIATLTRTGVTTFTGTAQCSRPAFTDIGGRVERKGETIIDQGGLFASVNCDGVTSWEAQVENGDGLRLVPGKVQVSMIGLFIDNATSQEVFGRAGPTTVKVIPAAANNGVAQRR